MIRLSGDTNPNNECLDSTYIEEKNFIRINVAMHEIKMSTFSKLCEAEESRKADVNKRATRTVSNDVCGSACRDDGKLTNVENGKGERRDAVCVLCEPH